MTASDDYDQAFFDMHLQWRADYEWLAGTLAQLLPHETALDLGCGCGFTISRLATLGRRVRMIDGSAHARRHDERIEVLDLRERHQGLGLFELVICTEVAEHLPESSADNLVDTICDSAQKFVFFSAAKPGFGGHHHLNEQQPAYWLSRFQQHGVHLHTTLTSMVRAQLRAGMRDTWWFSANGMVLTA